MNTRLDPKPSLNGSPISYTYLVNGGRDGQTQSDLVRTLSEMPPHEPEGAEPSQDGYADLRVFSDQVESLISHLHPDWNREGLFIAEVCEVLPDTLSREPRQFVYFNPALSMLLEHLPDEPLTRIVARYPGHGTTITLDLEDEHSDHASVRRLRIDVPRDANRAEIAFAHCETLPTPDGRPMIDHLNNRPDSDVSLLLAVMDSLARVSRSSRDRRTMPAYMYGIWHLDNAARAAGLYALESRQQSILARLAPEWRGTFHDLRAVVLALSLTTSSKSDK